MMAIISISINGKEDDIYLIKSVKMCFFYVISILIGLCICKCSQSKKCLRIEIIYSFDFDKIFIGTSINDKNRYITINELSINEIDRFILKKKLIGSDFI